MKNNFKYSLIALAWGSSLSFFTNVAMADSATSGYVVGHANVINGESLSDAVITIKNTATGLTRTVTTSSNGNYKFPLLPT